MRRQSWAAVPLAAAFCLAFAAPVAAASPFIDVSQDRGSSAYADSGTCIEDFPKAGDFTCEYTSAQVFDSASRYNGERYRAAAICIFTGTTFYDASKHTYSDSYTSGCLEGADISFGKALASASAAGTVPTETVECVIDEDTGEGTCSDPVPAGDVAVDLDWTGIPPVYKSTSRGRDQYGDCTSTYFSKGSWSDATVSGTLDDDAASFDYASINSGKSRYTYACHQ